MRYLNHGLLLLPTLICLVMGFRWIIEPAAVAPEFGFDLGSGLGRSSQIADLASFFLPLRSAPSLRSSPRIACFLCPF